MRTLGLLLALAVALVVGQAQAQNNQIGPPNGIACNLLLQATVTGTGSAITTSLQNGNPSAIIQICGWHITDTGTTAGSFQLEYGTQGGPCTSPTTITPSYGVGTTPTTDHMSYALFSIPKGAQLCVVTNGANTSVLQIGVWASITQ